MKPTFKNAVRSLIAASLLFSTALTVAQASTSGLVITEWMYNPSGTGIGGTNTGEFVEFTNFGPASIDMTGWSFDDNTRTPGSESLSAFGVVAKGESVIFTDATAAAFRAAWSLSASVKIIGGNLDNLGRSDEINLYNSSNTLVDRLTYNDQGTGTVKGPRTLGVSGEALNASVLGTNNASQWTLATVGDSEGAYTSSFGDIGSPGKTAFIAAVPEPQTYALMLAGLGLVGFVAGRKKKNT
ncbi:MAG: lamin tail domain-containing protein [Burkholderiaceae bacterium]